MVRRQDHRLDAASPPGPQRPEGEYYEDGDGHADQLGEDREAAKPPPDAGQVAPQRAGPGAGRTDLPLRTGRVHRRDTVGQGWTRAVDPTDPDEDEGRTP